MGRMVQQRGMGGWLTDWMWNAAGTVSPDQKTAQIADCAAALVKASGGSMSLQDATAQCGKDINAALSARNADPAQAGAVNAIFGNTAFAGLPNFGNALLWVGAGLLAFAFLRD